MLLLWVAAFTGCAGAERPRPQPQVLGTPVSPGALAEPTPGPLNRGVVEWRSAGVEVIYKRRRHDDIVVLDLILRGGCRNVSEADAGIEALALKVGTEGGTTSLERGPLMQKFERLTSAIFASAERDYSRISVRTTRQAFPAVMDLVDDILANATFADEPIAYFQQQEVLAARGLTGDPFQRLDELASQVMFAGHPYRQRPYGTEASLASLNAAKLRAHWRNLVVRDRALVVVVGDLDEAALRARLEATLGALPPHGTQGPYIDRPPPPLQSDAPRVRFDAQDTPTTYILGQFVSPSVTSPDYAPLSMSVKILSNRLFTEVRTKRSLSYSTRVRLQSALASFGGFRTTAQDPEALLGVVFDEIERMQREPVSARELAGQINLHLTSYYMSLQTNAAQAQLLGEWEIMAGHREAADEVIRRLQEVTSDDVQRVSRRYLRNFRFGVMGPADRYRESLYLSH